MKRASAAQHSRRVNQAFKCLGQGLPPAEAARRVARHHHLSMRQAYRYVHFAQQTPAPVPIPEDKAVFTVKLPCRLIRRVRRLARHDDVTISDWVAAALRRALPVDSTHG